MYASLPYLLAEARSEACLAMSNPPLWKKIFGGSYALFGDAMYK